MARQLREQFVGGVYHIFARGNERKSIYRDDTDRRLFLGMLAECARRFGWIITAYCLMTNHYHLLVELTRETLSSGLHWLDTVYTGKFNWRHQRDGHLLQGRPETLLVEKENYLLTVLRYIVLNPVEAGMVSKPEDYEWSSYPATAGLVPAPDWLPVDDVLAMFSPHRGLSQQMYRDYVHAGIGLPSPFEQAVGRTFLGSPAWIAEMKDRIERKPRDYEHPRAQRYLGRPQMAQIIGAVASAVGVAEEYIRTAHGGAPRMLSAWLGCYEGQMTLSTIGAALRLRNAGHVSTLIRRCNERLNADPELHEMKDRCVATLRGGEKTSET